MRREDISRFMADIQDEFKIVVVQAIRALCHKYPQKHRALLNFLSSVLREEGGGLVVGADGLDIPVCRTEALVAQLNQPVVLGIRPDGQRSAMNVQPFGGKSGE